MTKSSVKSSIKSAKKVAAKSVAFDAKAAIDAASKAPAVNTTRCGGARESERFHICCAILEKSDKALTMNQIKAAYFAGTGLDASDKKEAKMVYETVFQHSDACGNANRKKSLANAAFTRDTEGKYTMKNKKIAD